MTLPCVCRCTCAASLDQRGLPDHVVHPGPGSDWDNIPLGVTADGEEVSWDVRVDAHALAAGPAGAGKSVAQRVVLTHALHYPAHWQVVALDPKGVEHDWLRQHGAATVYSFADASAGALELRDEFARRCAERDGAVGRSLLIVVDATEVLVRDPDVAAVLVEIARLGRTVGMHLHLSSQDPLRLPKPLLANLGLRVAQKAITATEATVLFGSDQASGLARVPGRSFVGVEEGAEPFQAYYAPAP